MSDTPKQFVVIVGNLSSGIRALFGPFATVEAAQDWGADRFDDEWFSADVLAPTDIEAEDEPPPPHRLTLDDWLDCAAALERDGEFGAALVVIERLIRLSPPTALLDAKRARLRSLLGEDEGSA
jgi:hypothetical protein